MTPRTTHKLAIIAACCVGIGSYSTAFAGGNGHGGGGGMGSGGGNFGSHGFGAGNSAFGRSQFGNPQMGSGNSFSGRTKAEKTRSRTIAKKAKKDASAKKHIARGNSGFGHRQGDPATRTKGSQNSAFGQARASGRTKAEKTRSRTIAKKAKKDASAKKHIARGNSAFGHRQGDPATRTKGSQNSAFGQARAAAARGDDTTSTVTGTAVTQQTGPGNSDFGHRQGDPENRTTGSQNSAFGQARAAEVKARPTPPTPSQ
jgi:hypothetical protein